MPSEITEILKDAIARNCAMIVSLPSAGLLRHCKSRFLGEAPEGFWAEASLDEQPIIAELLQNATPVGITFRSGPNKILFTVPILEFNPSLPVNGTIQVPALRFPIPAEVKSVQRRSHYRVSITADTEVSARVWKMTEHAHVKDRPLPSMELKAELRDISLGGIGVVLRSRTGGEAQVATGQRVRVEINFAEESVVIEGRIRAANIADKVGILRTGIAFKPLDGQLEGRQKLALLTRLVGDLQRDEVKRLRRNAV